jgi:hypothetical protein
MRWNSSRITLCMQRLMPLKLAASTNEVRVLRVQNTMNRTVHGILSPGGIYATRMVHSQHAIHATTARAFLVIDCGPTLHGPCLTAYGYRQV